MPLKIQGGYTRHMAGVSPKTRETILSNYSDNHLRQCCWVYYVILICDFVWLFGCQDYKCMVEYYMSHFLVHEGKARVGRKRMQTLLIDTVDRGSSRWRGADVLIFNTAHWLNHYKTKSGWVHDILNLIIADCSRKCKYLCTFKHFRHITRINDKTQIML